MLHRADEEERGYRGLRTHQGYEEGGLDEVCCANIAVIGSHTDVVGDVAKPYVGRRADGVVGVGGGGAGARDSQLLTLAARRRQLFSERLNQHIHVLAAIAHPSNRNATLLQPEQRNVSSVLAKRVLPAEETVARGDKLGSGISKEVARPTIDAKSSMAMKLFQDPRSRAGFLNNRRKESEGARIDTTTRVIQGEDGGIGGDGRMNDDKLDGPEQEAVVDPDEEFQVDESSHGIYLLNFSDATNITDITKNKILTNNETKENILDKVEFAIKEVNISKIADEIEERMVLNTTTTDVKNTSTPENFTNTIKTENLNESENKTLFMSDEIYNHFRPLESELRAEDMAQFLFFGQKLSTPLLSGENFTNPSSFSASTKSVNLIVPPTEKKKYTSRYSATEKNKFNNVGEEEVNEEMDVSVIKNLIEKNKIRNSVKGPAPARHISLLNAYRKPLSAAPLTRLPNADSNVTLINETRATNFTGREFILRSNYRNLSRGYLNTRRRPVRLTTVDSVSPLPTNTTTEKSSTLVYTAVVTSVSITSSVKGQNKTDSSEDLDMNSGKIGNATLAQLNSTTTENETETTTLRSPSTFKSRHRLRIKTTTERISTEESVSSSTALFLIDRRQPVYKSQDVPKYVNESQASAFGFSPRSGFGVDANKSSGSDVIGTKLSLDGILTIDQSDINKSEAPSTVPTGVIKTRRRSTTTTTSIPSTVSTSTTQSSQIQNSEDFNETSGSIEEEVESYSTPSVFTSNSIENAEVEANDIKTHENERASLDINPNENYTNSTLTSSNLNDKESENISIKPNEEVVIEAEKNYTASYVLAGLGFLPVTAIVVFVLRNILLKKTKELDTEYEGYFDEEPKKESPITPVARPAMPLPVKPDRKWEFPRNKLRLQTLLGQGNFGQVWKAEADDLSGHDGLTRLVAVKTIKDTATQKEKQELLHEICIMQKLGSHPNVVTLLACCTEQEPYLLVMEYVMCGKLLTYLRERRSRPDRFGGSGALTSRDLTVFAYCVARGMEYLASKGVVHRDLAARNVLVDHNKLCKIADFGMSREVSGSAGSGEGGEGGGGGGGGRSQRHALPVRWMAPEALLYNVFNHETDVWAYGILLWEIVTLGSTPYAAMSGREVLQVVTEGYRLERPAHCKPALYRAMHACWHAAPAQRPAFADIKAQLADLLDNEPSEGNYVDLDSFYQDSSVYSDPSAIVADDADEDYAPAPPRNRVARASSAAEFDARLGFTAPPLRHRDFVGSPRMSGFGIRDCGFGERGFERAEGECEIGGQLGGRGSFSGGGLQRLGSRSFQLIGDSGGGGGRNKRVPEFECDI